ncbi:fasciclin domain-containing protein [Haloferula chungangensis]|uniref:Fasciclin domain-containing protein n=1 Tax=Haloferula chungangensis TaxID=1048331 RepID=A0ABW2LAL0_9BACT
MKLTKTALFLMFLPMAFAEQPETKQKIAKGEMELPELGTIAKMVKDSQNFSILKAAVEAAGIAETFEGKGPFTVFAPTDEAFNKLDKETLDALMLPANKEKLRSLLLYHVVAGTRPAASLKDEKITSMNGEDIEVDVDDGKVEIEDDANVVNADLMASNGVIHVIDKVIVPESLDGFEGLDED